MAELLIYGEVGEDWWTPENSLTEKTVSVALNQIPKTDNQLIVKINSLGGDVGSGLAIYNSIRNFVSTRKFANSSFKSETHVEGYAYSIASIIALATDEVKMHEASMMMIHRAWGFFGGNSVDLADAIKYLEKTDNLLAGVYSRFTGKDVSHCLSLMDAETFMSSNEAVNAGYAHSVIKDTIKARNCYSDDRSVPMSKGEKPYSRYLGGRLAARLQAKAADVVRRGESLQDDANVRWVRTLQALMFINSQV